MLPSNLVDTINGLEETQLRELYSIIVSKLQVIPPRVSYRHELVGKQRYWYAYFRYKNKMHSVYIGKEKRIVDPGKVLEKKGIELDKPKNTRG